jgi:murein DD-endopeptidase MepM/ murein hydrolase activator NlpD
MTNQGERGTLKGFLRSRGNGERGARMRALLLALLLVPAPLSLLPAQGLPPLPDTTGWGVHVLALARDETGTIWAGTYGQGIFRLPAGSRSWENLHHDTTATSLSWDFIHAIAFGLRGEIWYGTVGNGWGLSTDGGTTWRNWTLSQLGPEWQYVAPNGIQVRGDTAFVGTADGIQFTTDDGQHWTALIDSVGPPSRGPADTAYAVLQSEYIRRLGLDRRGLLVATPKGNQRLILTADGWLGATVPVASFAPLDRVVVGGVALKGTLCGIRLATDTMPCYNRPSAPVADSGKDPLTTWFRRPISRNDNSYIDQTYRYGSTMGGNFQQHQGVEFNNADGTPVHAIGRGEVVYAGPAEAGALTVAIRQDSILATPGGRYFLFSVYYHNSSLLVKVGDRVATGQVISLVGNTGRATNDHLHLEVHASPVDSVHLIVDSLERYPRYTTNPELWIDPLPGTGIVAGTVRDTAGRPVPQARIYGLIKPEPTETPFSYAETYGDKAHSHPLYGEDFAVGDVLPGTYIIGTTIDGVKVFRKVIVEAGKLTWVVFQP